MPSDKHRDKDKNDLYKVGPQLVMLVEVVHPFSFSPQEALERGVVVYLPEISSGGKPVMKKNRKSDGKDRICKDPIKLHSYNAIS